MRFKVECKSLLLQKALEEFLKDYIFEDGMIISDEDGDIIIGKDIKKPFSKSQLLLQLEKISQKKANKKEFQEFNNINDKLEIDMDIFDDLIQKEENKQDDSFEKKLDILIDEFSIKLKNLIKEEYGKK